MCAIFKRLMRLYPADVRFAYGDEMLAAFEQGLRTSRPRGRAALATFACRQLVALVCDAAAERVNSLYSHRTFHGRCRPNRAAVRPPNMSVREWFQ